MKAARSTRLIWRKVEEEEETGWREGVGKAERKGKRYSGNVTGSWVIVDLAGGAQDKGSSGRMVVGYGYASSSQEVCRKEGSRGQRGIRE